MVDTPRTGRLTARMRLLTGLGVMAAGLALALSLLLRGHAPGNAVLIRIGLFFTVAGLALLASSVRGGRRSNSRTGHADQQDDQPSAPSA